MTPEQEAQLRAICEIEGFTLSETEQLITEWKRYPQKARKALETWKLSTETKQ